MDLECPLLRGSSDRRLRRYAATLPPLLERTFPGSIFSSVFAGVMAAVRDLLEGNISFGVHHLNETYCCQQMYRTSPSCCVRSHSLGASILRTVLTGLVTGGCIHRCCHRLCDLPLPWLPGSWTGWVASSNCWGLAELSGAAVHNHMPSWAHLNHHRSSQFVIKATQLMIYRSFLEYRRPISLWSWEQSAF